MRTRRVAILGSTGSIGRSTLDVLRGLRATRGGRTRFEVAALSAGANWEVLADQAEEFAPEKVALASEEAAGKLRSSGRLDGVEILSGKQAIESLAGGPGSDTVVLGMVGSAGLKPAFAALSAGKRLAVANKEPIVIAGEILAQAAKAHGGEIIPMDSEHSAILQVLRSGQPREVKRIILTASGGPFKNAVRDELASVTLEEALRHPTWTMGRKVTIDSATMMNKALEVLEAKSLFSLPVHSIDVWIHPQSIVHGIVEFVDGSFVAQMAPADMKLPIQFALTYPERVGGTIERLSLENIRELSFEEPSGHAKEALELAYRAGDEGRTAPAVLSGANEAAVGLFVAGRIGFSRIVPAVREAMEQVERPEGTVTLESVLEADSRARSFVLDHHGEKG